MIKSNFRGIRFKLIVVFWTSLIASIIFGGIINGFALKNQKADYGIESNYSYKEFNSLIDKINDLESDSELDNIIEENKEKVNIFKLDDNGKVIKKGNDRSEQSFDLDIIKNKDKYTLKDEYKFELNYLTKLNSTEYIYLNTIINKGDMTSMFLLSVAISFILLFLTFTHKELKYIKYLCKGLNEIAYGNLDYRVEVKGKDEISEIAKSINGMTEKLYKAKEDEKRIEKSKDNFIMNISHDLRTPLTSIVGYIDLIKEKYDRDDEIKDYINIIDLKSQRLDKLINNFFEYNKLINGEVKLEKINISLNEFLRQVVTGMMVLCNEKNLKIKLLLPPKELKYELDPEKMLRVMENLITNAIKYCDENSDIIISLIQEENNYVITTENTCSNLKNTDNLDKLFERFYRGDKSRNTSSGGAGLGLAIAKSIVELHKGHIYSECKGNKIVFKIILYNPTKI